MGVLVIFIVVFMRVKAEREMVGLEEREESSGVLL